MKKKVFLLSAFICFLIFHAQSCCCKTPSRKNRKPEFTQLFPDDTIPEGWTVRHWADVSRPAPEGAEWTIKDGILHGSTKRGTWLMSKEKYADFELTFSFKLGRRGNSGCALRAPMKGDPAFDGLELQMADLRYNTRAKDSELTGGFYRAKAPLKQVYKPEEWNSYHIILKGSKAVVKLNGTLIHECDFTNFDKTVPRHNGTPAPALRDRPLSGHIGFQELSRDGDHVMIRNPRIKVLKKKNSHL